MDINTIVKTNKEEFDKLAAAYQELSKEHDKLLGVLKIKESEIYNLKVRLRRATVFQGGSNNG